jgi:subtilisin family serine protease
MSKAKLLLTLSILVIGGLIMAARGFQASEASEPAAIDPGLRQSIVDAGSGEYLLYLHQQADLSAAATMDWSARGQFVYNTLLETARTSQADLLRLLKDQQVAGNVQYYQSYFIANAILVNSNVAAFDLLALHPDVARMEIAPTFYIEEPQISDAEAIEWGVQRINAPQIWSDLGTTGEGVVVANIDTGVDYDHPAVVNQYRGNLGGGSYDHDFNWYDPSKICGNPSVAPCDNNNHGTHTMGTMVGDDGGANQIGVAPGAKWIASKGCESGSCSTNALLKSFEWIIAPCPLNIEPGNPSCDPNMRPDVVNNSWGSSGGNTTYLTSVQNLRAADIFPAFSAGNSGPGPGTMGSPGDYAESFAAGATDINDVIASFSSRGPSTLTNEMKPDVSAPGVNVRSSINGGGYANFDGTSMASPHVAGCFALLQSIDPAMTLDEAENLMRDNALDLGAAGPDYTYGFGRLDCFAAASQLSPGFSLSATPASAAVCAPGNRNFNLAIGQIAGYVGNVTLSATGAPGSVNFSVNPVPVPGASVLNLGSGAVAGNYVVDVNGTAPGADPKTTSVELGVFTGNPGAVTLVAPANGAMDVPLVPTFSWNAAAQGYAYLIAVKNITSGALMYAVTYDTSYTFDTPLDPLAIHVWSVRPYNPCGAGAFAQFRVFRTQDIPPILVVDDDDNAPDVRATYTAVLDGLGLGYDIWDTNNSDNEPDAATLQQYDAVIWFTGDEFGGSAGPGAAGETALATYLNANGCLLISSQDYVWDRGVTAFMQATWALLRPPATSVRRQSPARTSMPASAHTPWPIRSPTTATG